MAGVEDLDRCASVLSEAFAIYAWTRWTIDPIAHRSRVTALQRLALQHFGLSCGEVWVTTVDGVIESVAAWVDSARIEAHAVDESVIDVMARLEGSRHEASVAAERQVASRRPQDRYYFLGTVGTTSGMQGRGLGTKSVRPLLESADRDHVNVFLETSSESNVAWYTTLGFRVVDHLAIDSGGPDVWAMLRPPAGGLG